jgi:hypothetical protein
MSDLTPEERRLVAQILRDVAPLMDTTANSTLAGLAAKVEIGVVTDALHDAHDRVEHEIRDMLVEQTRTLVAMADNLSGSLGHSLALLAAIDERDDIALPSMSGVVDSGRTAIQAWHEAKPHIDKSLAAVED